MNVGYLEALKVDKFDCFVFQDADLLPETDKNLYMCDPHAHHLASAINEMRYQYVVLGVYVLTQHLLPDCLSVCKKKKLKQNSYVLDA
jgi:hypothetical protein